MDLNRTLPNNAEAECNFLACLIMEPENIKWIGHASFIAAANAGEKRVVFFHARITVLPFLSCAL